MTPITFKARYAHFMLFVFNFYFLRTYIKLIFLYKSTVMLTCIHSIIVLADLQPISILQNYHIAT